MQTETIVDNLRGMTSWNDFAASLVSQYERKGFLSDRQQEAAQRMIAKMGETAQRKERLTRQIDVRRIETLLADATQSKLKKPVFHAADLSFSLAGRYSRNPGAVYVKTGDTYMGKVLHGTFTPSAAATEQTVRAVEAVAMDPLGEAIKYGRLTGRCACCNRKLSDEKSVALGIGPVCKTKWRL
jgi:hypothetical protein